MWCSPQFLVRYLNDNSTFVTRATKQNRIKKFIQRGIHTRIENLK